MRVARNRIRTVDILAVLAGLAVFAAAALSIARLSADVRLLGIASDGVGQDEQYRFSELLDRQGSRFGTVVALHFLAVPFVMAWFHRLRRNAQIITPHYWFRYSAAWSVGGWVLPVANLWVPRQVATDIHRASRTPDQDGPGEGLLYLWWTAWLLYVVTFHAALFQYASTYSGGYFISVPDLEPLWYSTAASLLGATAGVLFLCVITQLTLMQRPWVAMSQGRPGPFALPARPPLG
jgi:hypothetical protein